MKRILSHRQTGERLVVMVSGTDRFSVREVAHNLHMMVAKENRLRERDGKERVSFEIIAS